MIYTLPGWQKLASPTVISDSNRSPITVRIVFRITYPIKPLIQKKIHKLVLITRSHCPRRWRDKFNFQFRASSVSISGNARAEPHSRLAQHMTNFTSENRLMRRSLPCFTTGGDSRLQPTGSYERNRSIFLYSDYLSRSAHLPPKP